MRALTSQGDLLPDIQVLQPFRREIRLYLSSQAAIYIPRHHEPFMLPHCLGKGEKSGEGYLPDPPS